MTLDLETLEWCLDLVKRHGGHVHFDADRPCDRLVNRIATKIHDEIITQKVMTKRERKAA